MTLTRVASLMAGVVFVYFLTTDCATEYVPFCLAVAFENLTDFQLAF